MALVHAPSMAIRQPQSDGHTSAFMPSFTQDLDAVDRRGHPDPALRLYRHKDTLATLAATCTAARRRHDSAGATAPDGSAEAVTRMLPRDRAELIVAEHAAGKPVRVIAEAYGHSITTVRDYAHGRRTPASP
jgi:hypothetical protein